MLIYPVIKSTFHNPSLLNEAPECQNWNIFMNLGTYVTWILLANSDICEGSQCYFYTIVAAVLQNLTVKFNKSNNSSKLMEWKAKTTSAPSCGDVFSVWLFGVNTTTRPKICQFHNIILKEKDAKDSEKLVTLSVQQCLEKAVVVQWLFWLYSIVLNPCAKYSLVFEP